MSAFVYNGANLHEDWLPIIEAAQTVKRPDMQTYVHPEYSGVSKKTCNHLLVDERGSMGDGFDCVLCGYMTYADDIPTQALVWKLRLLGRVLAVRFLVPSDEEAGIADAVYRLSLVKATNVG